MVVSSSDGHGCASRSEVDASGWTAAVGVCAITESAVAVVAPALDRAVIEDGAGLVAPPGYCHRVSARPHIDAHWGAAVSGCAVAELAVRVAAPALERGVVEDCAGVR